MLTLAADTLTYNSRKNAVKWSDICLFIVIAGSLVPSLSAGVSPVELLSFVMVLFSCVFCVLSYYRSMALPFSMMLFVIMILWTPLSLFHTSLSEYLRVASGLGIFMSCLLIGAWIPGEKRSLLFKLLVLCAAAGTFRDIIFDMMGWAQAGSRFENSRWTLGARGIATSRSIWALFLACFAGPFIFSKNRRTAVLAISAMAVCMFSVAVMGQGRGLTLLLILIMAICAFISDRKNIIIICVIAAIGILFVGSMDKFKSNPYLAPVISRFTQLADDDNQSRIEHSRYGIEALMNLDMAGIMTGVGPSKVEEELGEPIHNGYLYIMLYFGLISALLFLAYWVIVFIQSVFMLIQSRNVPIWVICASCCCIIHVLMLVVSPAFQDWRLLVLPGLLIGMFQMYCWQLVKNKHKDF